MMKSCDMRFPGGKKHALTFSYDDGVKQDVRLCGLFRDHGVKGTFNINSGLFFPEGEPYPEGNHRLTEKDIVALYAENPAVEVACHSKTHGFLDRQQPTVCLSEVIDDRKHLEKLFGRIVAGMAYPFGTFNDSVVEALRMAGIHYCRTVQSTHRFDVPTDWLRMPATCHHNDPELMALGEKFLAPFEEGAPRLFYVWGHSYEFDNNDNWEVMERFLDCISGKDYVWYATNGEIYDYVKCYESLVWSADMSMIHNPTATDVWVAHRKETIHIPAGQTVTVESAKE